MDCPGDKKDNNYNSVGRTVKCPEDESGVFGSLVELRTLVVTRYLKGRERRILTVTGEKTPPMGHTYD